MFNKKNKIYLCLAVMLLGCFLFLPKAVSASPTGAGNALDFDGLNDYVVIPNNAHLNITGTALTLEAWIKIDITGVTHKIISNIDVWPVHGGYMFRVGSDQSLQWFYYNGGWRGGGTAANTIATNTWYHAAAVLNGTSQKLYLNGVEVYSTTQSTAIPSSPSTNFYIGKSTYDEARWFDGQIDEVRIWNVARSAAQLRENMMTSLTGSETGLKAYYPMDQTNTTTLLDATANGNNGTLMNMDLATDWTSSTAYNMWIGSESNAWNTAANWSRNAVPTTTDNVGLYKWDGYNNVEISGTPTVNHLYFSSTTVPTVSSNFTVNGNLTLDKNIDISGRAVTLGSDASLVEGDYRLYGAGSSIATTRSLSNVSAQNVAGLGAIITTAQNMGSTIITRYHSTQSLGSNTSIARYYDIIPTNNSSLNATFNFSYNDNELGGNTESNLKLFKSTDGGSTWSLAGGTVNATTNVIATSSVSGFSRWTAGNGSFFLTYTAGSGGTITGSSTQVINYGSSGSEVTAVPDTGYMFTQWSDGSTSTTRTDNNITTSTSYTASFVSIANVFTYTGSNQSFVIPAGINQITIKVWGAGGGGRTGSYSTYSGGSGGYAEAVLNVTPGASLVVVVGGGGQFGSSTAGLGGWPGGGYGTYGDAPMGGGGGVTGVFLNSYSHANSLIIAGAGGGGGYKYGGGGGGVNGSQGGGPYTIGGYGGTQSAGGSGSTYGADCSALQGGNGDTRGARTSLNDDGGGGGGGYYGGEGGYQDATGGGGGSGFVSSSYSVSSTLTTGTNGTTTAVSAPNITDPNYVAGVGAGARGTVNGGNGLVVIYCATSTVTNYNLIFQDHDGSELQSTPYQSGASLSGHVNPSNPTKTGYTFTGWSASVPSTMPGEDVIITAQYSINQYTISFDSSGGSSVNSITQNYGTAISSPTNPTKTGYTFTGWNPLLPSTMPAYSATHTAQFTTTTFTLTYTTGGNGTVSGSSTQIISYGENGSPVEAVPNTGYTFVEWSDTLEDAIRVDVNVIANLNVSAVFADITAPTISNLSSTTTANSATITWTTNEGASTILRYGVSTNYGVTVNDASVSTTHSVSIGGLASCVTYYYHARSRDADLNSASSTGSFTTLGCVGSASVIAGSEGTVSTSTQSTASLTISNVLVLRLSIPANYATKTAVFQIKKIDDEEALVETGSPITKEKAGDHFYTLTAISDDEELEVMDVFAQPITITINYTSADIVGLDEDTLQIYHWNENAWSALSNCSVNKSEKSVTCTTQSFSSFAIFGDSVSVPPSSSGGGGGVIVSKPLVKSPPTIVGDKVIYNIENAEYFIVSSNSAFVGYGWKKYIGEYNYDKNATGTLYLKFRSKDGGESNVYAVYLQTGSKSVDQKNIIAKYKFVRDLKQGMSGADVKELQRFLNMNGFMVNTAGVGSLGKESSYFGLLTKKALIKFQKANKITPAIGYFGPKTRSIIRDK